MIRGLDPQPGVGATSIRRWPRPICLQDSPNALLPDERKDRPSGGSLPRRVDGRLLVDRSVSSTDVPTT